MRLTWRAAVVGVGTASLAKRVTPVGPGLDSVWRQQAVPKAR
jgi:hypothetical protein